mgnify:FL=1
MNMREAFEKWCSIPYHKELKREAFEAGYAAAIEAVKAGGPVGWVHPCYLKAGALGLDVSPVQFGPEQIPLYKLPEEMQ